MGIVLGHRLHARQAPALVAGVVICQLLLGRGTVVASCGAPPSPTAALAKAPIAFLGTITAISNGGSLATVHVEEIWKGPNVGETAMIDGAALSGEDTRSWRLGTRYLFFPTTDSDGNLLDSGCSPTSVYTQAFDALRPAQAHPPLGPPTSGVPGSPPIAAIFLGILVLGSLGGFLLYRSDHGTNA